MTENTVYYIASPP